MGSRICPAAFCNSSLWTSVILVRLLARFFGIPDLISLLYVSLFPMHSTAVIFPLFLLLRGLPLFLIDCACMEKYQIINIA